MRACPIRRRLGGSVALALKGAEAGVQLLRVHDVRETVQALRVWRGLRDTALASIDAKRRIAVLGEMLELGDAPTQHPRLVLQLDEPGDRGQAHALRRQGRDLAELLDVPQRVPPQAALRAPGHDQAEPVVGAQGLRVHAGELGGGGDDEVFFLASLR